MIVVDTNVVAYLLLEGPQTAPALWRSELRNVLSGYLRRGQLDRKQVLALQGQAEALQREREVPVNSAEVFPLDQALS